MNSFLGSSEISTIKSCEDEKAVAITIGSFVANHYTVDDPENIDRLTDNDIANAFDSMIGKLLSDIDIGSANGDIEKFTQEDLVKISKAGNYIRYAAYDLIKGLKAYSNNETVDFEQIMVDAIDRKIEEDTVDPASEEEVDKLISETEDIIDKIPETEDAGINFPNNKISDDGGDNSLAAKSDDNDNPLYNPKAFVGGNDSNERDESAIDNSSGNGKSTRGET